MDMGAKCALMEVDEVLHELNEEGNKRYPRGQEIGFIPFCSVQQNSVVFYVKA